MYLLLFILNIKQFFFFDMIGGVIFKFLNVWIGLLILSGIYFLVLLNIFLFLLSFMFIVFFDLIFLQFLKYGML